MSVSIVVFFVFVFVPLTICYIRVVHYVRFALLCCRTISGALACSLSLRMCIQYVQFTQCPCVFVLPCLSVSWSVERKHLYGNICSVLCVAVYLLAQQPVFVCLCVCVSLSFRFVFLLVFCSFRHHRRRRRRCQCRLLLLLLLLFNNRWKSAYTCHFIAIENSVQFITACWSEHKQIERRGSFWAWAYFWLPSPLLLLPLLLHQY